MECVADRVEGILVLSVCGLLFLAIMRDCGKIDTQRQVGFSVSHGSSRHLRFLAGSRLCDLRMVFPRPYFGVEVSFHGLKDWTLLP